MNVTFGTAFIPAQHRRHFRLGISNWGQLKGNCLLNPSDHACKPGFDLEVFRILMLMLNFTVDIKYSDIQGCGGLSDNGSTSGLLNMLENDEIDIIGNLCNMDTSRSKLKWLTCSWPVLQQKQAFLIKAPMAELDLNFFAPFDLSLWFFWGAVIFVFLILFMFVYRVRERATFRNAFNCASKDVFFILFGFGCDVVYCQWFYFICLMGFSQILYSTFFTISSLKPSDIERPFRDHEELAEKLFLGSYKLLEHNSAPYVRCYSDDVCNKIKTAIKTHGFTRSELNSADNSSYTNSDFLLSHLLDNSNLVLVKSRGMLTSYLDQFRERSKLWLIDDELSDNKVYCYFYRANFELSNLIDLAVILMGDSKENINDRYSALSSQSIQSKIIFGRLSKKMVFGLRLLRHFWFFYFGAITAASLVFIFEMITANAKYCPFSKSYNV